MSLTRQSFSDLITEVRDEVDEELDADAPENNFFTDTAIARWLNRGMKQIWQTTREEKKSNRFLRRLRSDDPILSIYGAPYDPAGMQLETGRDELALPPDCYEIRYLEPVLGSDDTESGIIFHFVDMGSDAFRVLSRSPGPTLGGTYRCDVIWREGGQVLRVTPPLRLIASVHIELEYVMGVRTYAAGDSLENSGFDDIMLDAIVDYAVRRARAKEGDAGQMKMAQDNFRESGGLVQRSVAPNQTVEPEVVNGFLEGFDE